MVHVQFKTEVSLEYYSEEYNGYFIKSTGRIFDIDDDEEDDDKDYKETDIGTIETVLIDADRIAQDGHDLWIEADRESGEMESLVCTFYEDGVIKDEILSGWGERRPNLLYIDTIDIKPEWRGRGIALAAIQRAIEIFCVKCDVAVLLPSPIERLPPAREVDEQELKLARQKLRRYYRALGFRSVRGTNFMVLDLENFAHDALLNPQEDEEA